MTCGARFVNAGTMTNYEMGPLRVEQEWRRRDGLRVRWIYPWASLAEEFHPRSQQEWDEHIDSQGEQGVI